MGESQSSDIPYISRDATQYLFHRFSADRQIQDGLLSDTNVVRSEAYLLGFLAGLQFCSAEVNLMLIENSEIHQELDDEQMEWGV